MSSYPHDDVIINGRAVSVVSIVSGAALGESDFERKTIAFIAEWIQGRDSFIQKTSGSTGPPKEIILTRSQMSASALMTIQALGLKQEYNALLCISPDYIGGKMMLVRSLIAGMKLVAVTPSSHPLSDQHADQRIDFAAMVPYQIHEIVRSPDAAKLNKMKTVIVGGASMDRETEEKLQDYDCIFYSTYGMTETVSHIALRQLNGRLASESYRVLPGIRISTDERSCLVIEWNQLTEKIVTNDIVEIVKENEFRWVGRWDNVINTGGLKVIPEKVEVIVKSIFDTLNVRNSFFVGSIDDAKLGNKITLFVEGQLSDELIDIVGQKMTQLISKTEAPKRIIFIQSFVLTENGKINRKATTKHYTKGM